MKTSEQTLAHLADVLAHIYLRPGMHAETPNELDSVIFQYHRIWGYITDRDHELLKVVSENRTSCFDEVPRPSWIYDRVHAPDVEPFQPIIKYWRGVDERIGLATGQE